MCVCMFFHVGLFRFVVGLFQVQQMERRALHSRREKGNSLYSNNDSYFCAFVCLALLC
jgi:hypothetical protein